jgi:type I restriction enzyme S subunit
VLKKSQGGAQPFIGLTELRNRPVIFCSLEEQRQIIQKLESRLSVCDKIEETINSSLKQAEALRQSILSRAFEGKLVQNNKF